MFPASIFGLLGKLLESFGIGSDSFSVFRGFCGTWIDADVGSKVVFGVVVEAFHRKSENVGSANATRATFGDGLDREKTVKAGGALLPITVMLSEAETSDCPDSGTVKARGDCPFCGP